ncbi:MbtH family NRPS accessory protein [Herbidospora yilanensis]|uniref:MbtH family NRPS accessory protein n=1 Tax=Herbidospora yilanensis TaxID=354426 RepID=UPI000A0365A4|nr:MbtH family NRPS accessory protein [Herbidospora yilanensis]
MAPRTFKVIMDGEGNYSLCPADREPPDGWVVTGVDGVFQEHLDRVAALWGVDGKIV